MVDELQKIVGEPLVARTKEDWDELEWNVRTLFKPRAPIDATRLFVGRVKQIRELIEVIYEDGAHAIIYGERGVGKTSLANIIKEQIIEPVAKYTKVIKVSCSPNDRFSSIWRNVFFDYKWNDGKTMAEVLDETPEPFTVYKIAESLGSGLVSSHVIILDEFDRIEDANTKTLIADTIKYLSDNPVRFTIVVVGVGNSINQLFGSHPSIKRCCVEIQMPRMSPEEMKQIPNDRLPKVPMSIDPDVLETMTKFAQGLPGYMHLLGQLSALVAIECRSQVIEMGHLTVAVKRALEAADESTRQAYYCAIQSTKPDNRYREVLLACARATKNEIGQFSANDVCEPYSEIMGRLMGIEHFARHLNAFCDRDRGPALAKSGKRRGYVYQFVNPLLEPLVLMRGLGEH